MSLFLKVLACHLSPVVEGANCKCGSIEEGIYDVLFAKPILPGYLKRAKMSVELLTDDIYKGDVLVPYVLPFKRIRLLHMSFLNGTDCCLRGSIHSGRLDTSLVYKACKIGDNDFDGTYHQLTKNLISDQILDMELTWASVPVQITGEEGEASMSVEEMSLFNDVVKVT